MLAKSSPWRGRKYFLDKMTLGELVVAFFTHHSILVYLALAAAGAGFGAGWAGAGVTSWPRPLLPDADAVEGAAGAAGVAAGSGGAAAPGAPCSAK